MCYTTVYIVYYINTVTKQKHHDCIITKVVAIAMVKTYEITKCWLNYIDNIYAYMYVRYLSDAANINFKNEN